MTPAETARAALDAGLCPVPPREDGTKAPLGEWKKYQSALPDLDQIDAWYASGQRHGVGLVCGVISGHLEAFELEGAAMGAGLGGELRTLCAAAGISDVLDRVMYGYSEMTPSGGVHVLWRCPEGIEGNQKLAREQTGDPANPIRVLIETRGEGGYIVTAPSSGPVHPTGGEWRLTAGGFGSIAVVTAAERAELLRCARSLDRMPTAPDRILGAASLAGDDTRPGDRYNTAPDADDRTLGLLERHGWVRVPHPGTTIHLRRPGKTVGISATLGHYPGLFYVFSSSTDFEQERAYDHFGVLAVLEHGGDHRAAAKALVAEGFGTPSAKLRIGGRAADRHLSAVPDPDTDGYRWVDASALTPRRQRWLLQGRVPLKAVTVLGGVGGLGKSMWSARLTAQVTTGKAPGDLAGQPRRVLISSAEDTWEETIYPRLKAAGADLALVTYLALPDLATVGAQLPLSRFMGYVRQVVTERGDISLWVIDPVVSFIDEDIDSHNDHSVRAGVISPLTGLVHELNIGALGIMHLNKKADREAWERIGGSVGFYNGVRSVLVWGRDPDDPKGERGDQRALVSDKSNYGSLPDAEIYVLEHDLWVGTDPDDGSAITASRATFLHTATLSSRTVMDGRRPATKADTAETVLRGLLNPHGWVPASVAIAYGERAGVAERTMQRAKAAMGLDSRRLAHADDPLQSTWCWVDPTAQWPPDDPSKVWPDDFSPSPPETPPKGGEQLDLATSEGPNPPGEGNLAPSGQKSPDPLTPQGSVEGAKGLAPSVPKREFLASSLKTPSSLGAFDESGAEGAISPLPGGFDESGGVIDPLVAATALVEELLGGVEVVSDLPPTPVIEGGCQVCGRLDGQVSRWGDVPVHRKCAPRHWRPWIR